jgi:hypothetical protein
VPPFVQVESLHTKAKNSELQVFIDINGYTEGAFEPWSTVRAPTSFPRHPRPPPALTLLTVATISSAHLALLAALRLQKQRKDIFDLTCRFTWLHITPHELQSGVTVGDRSPMAAAKKHKTRDVVIMSAPWRCSCEWWT